MGSSPIPLGLMKMLPLQIKTILLKNKVKLKLITKKKNHLYIRIEGPLNYINYRVDLKKNKVLFKKDRIIFFENSWGLDRLLIVQNISGVLRSFTRKLGVFGMGYKFSFDVNLHSLILSIGYSHAVTYKVPSNISVKVVKKNQLSLHSVDYRSLMQAIATLKSFKKLDVFKGKGIRIPEEKLLLKEGKKGKK